MVERGLRAYSPRCSITGSFPARRALPRISSWIRLAGDRHQVACVPSTMPLCSWLPASFPTSSARNWRPSISRTNPSMSFWRRSAACSSFAGGGCYEAVAANELEAKLLQVERGSPLVMLDSVSFLEDGRPVEYYHAVHRGDRSRFEVELVRSRSTEDAAQPRTSLQVTP